jgi:uncharacterized protein
LIVVSDSSPLIGLASIGHLELLRLLFGRVLIPEAVHREVTEDTGRPGAREVVAADWIEVRQIVDRPLAEQFRTRLGLGEREAIVLGLETNADFVLVDDRPARAAAVQLGLDVLGVAGVVLRAKSEGHVSAVRPLLDGLRRHGLRLHDDIYEAVLRAAGEEQS